MFGRRPLVSALEPEILGPAGVPQLLDEGNRFLLGAENALRSRPRDEEALKDEEIKKLKQKIGDLVMDLDILQTAIKLKEEREGRPFV